MNSMRFLRLSTCVLLWSMSARDADGGVQMMLLKALQHVKTVPIILSVSRSNPRRHRALASDLVDVKTLPSGIADPSVDSLETKTLQKKKFTKKSKTHPKVEYIYLKGNFPKKYRRKPFPGYLDYFNGPVKKELLYEDEDHKFIRVSALKPPPRYTHVRVIHVNNANAKDCPYLASQTPKEGGHLTPHPQNVVSKPGAVSHPSTVETQHRQPQHHHDVKHVVHHINYLSHPQNHDHREAYASKHESVVGGTYDRRQHFRPETSLVAIPKGPPRHKETGQTHGQSSSAITYHKDTTSPVGPLHEKGQIVLHLVSDQMHKHFHKNIKESNFEFSQLSASSGHRERPQHKKNNNHHHHHQIPQHEFYQPRFPDEQENSNHLESHLTTNFHDNPGHDDDNSIFAESAVYADVMTRWPGKNAVVISNVKGTPVLLAPAHKQPPFRFHHGIRKRNGPNFIDVTIH